MGAMESRRGHPVVTRPGPRASTFSRAVWASGCGSRRCLSGAIRLSKLPGTGQSPGGAALESKLQVRLCEADYCPRPAACALHYAMDYFRMPRHSGTIDLPGSGLLLAILRLALLPHLVASEAPGRPLRQVTLRRRPKGVPCARSSPKTVLP
jgi:hypothetical protein